MANNTGNLCGRLTPFDDNGRYPKQVTSGEMLVALKCVTTDL